MKVSKINSLPTFRGQIIVRDVEYDNGTVTIDTENIAEIKKYKNGTNLKGFCLDYFVSNKTASFQDIAAAYNMAKDDTVIVDLSKNSRTYN